MAKVKTVKDICLGVAAAGVIAGAGAVATAAPATAEPTDSGSSTSTDATSSTTDDTTSTAATPKRPGQAVTDAVDQLTRQVTSALDSVNDVVTTATQGALSQSPLNNLPKASNTPSSRAKASTTPRSKSAAVADDTPGLVSVDRALQSTGLPTASSVLSVASPRTAAAFVDDVATQADAVVPAALSRPVTSAVTSVLAAATPVVDAAVALVTTTPILPAPTSPIPLPFIPVAPTSAVTTTTSSANANRSARLSATGDAVALVEPPKRVLVIGVDGTNLNRVLEDDENENFLALMNEGTTGINSIRGHTTISNPSWTAILTGNWDNQTGVINNVFTPWTYDTWSTVYNQLESYDPSIRTKAIADWDAMTGIAAAGTHRADDIVFVPHIEGDENWGETDQAVAEETAKSILGVEPGYEDVPNFMFTYLVQVDEAGHGYGGGSEEYTQALQRTDANIGIIMDAVKARELATGEEWTVIVVTDHGHQQAQGVGHGFQSPDETASWVIARGPDFKPGNINLDYEIVDVTPTVVALFGAPQDTRSDGVTLMSLDAGSVDPDDLVQAVNDAIALNGNPDIITDVALSLRTIFATPPYLIYGQTRTAVRDLQALADSGDFPLSTLAGVAVVPVQIIGGGLYVGTNTPAQVVAIATGVQGASVYPFLPPPLPYPFTPLPPTTLVTV